MKDESQMEDESESKSESKSKMTLKLLIDTKANKVLFGEVGKEFVDFLFHILSLPVGTIIKLLNVDSMVGSLGTVYKSVESLSNNYFQPNLNKESVLNPGAPVTVPLLALNHAPTPGSDKQLYSCNISSSDCAYDCNYYSGSGCRTYYTESNSTQCPNCRRQMGTVLKRVEPTKGTQDTPSGGGGYVKGVVTYMVLDNLEVKPMSTISAITLINKFRVKDVSALEEKEVQVGLEEGIAMLKASLEVSNNVLTTVFLSENIHIQGCSV